MNCFFSTNDCSGRFKNLKKLKNDIQGYFLKKILQKMNLKAPRNKSCNHGNAFRRKGAWNDGVTGTK